MQMSPVLPAPSSELAQCSSSLSQRSMTLDDRPVPAMDYRAASATFEGGKLVRRIARPRLASQSIIIHTPQTICPFSFRTHSMEQTNRHVYIKTTCRCTHARPSGDSAVLSLHAATRSPRCCHRKPLMINLLQCCVCLRDVTGLGRAIVETEILADLTPGL